MASSGNSPTKAPTDFSIDLFTRERDSKTPNLPDVIEYGAFEYDCETDSVELSESWFKMLEYDPNEHLNQIEFWRSILHPDDRERISEAFQNLKKNSEMNLVLQFRMLKPSGNYCWYKSFSRCIRDANGKLLKLIGWSTDVTVLIHAEADLRETQQRYLDVVENVSGVVYRCQNDRDWAMLFISDGIERLSGYRTEDFVGEHKTKTFGSLIHPDDVQMVTEGVQKAIEARELFFLEYRLVHRNGEIRWVNEKGKGIYDPITNELLFVEGLVLDVTQNKLLEDDLRIAQFALENVSEMVIWTDKTGRILFANQQVSRILKYSHEQLMKMRVHDIDVSHSEESWDNRWDTIRERKSVVLERTIRACDGELIPVEISANYIIYREKEMNCSFLRDITNRKKQEAFLREQQAKLVAAAKLSTLGEMAAGIAHEINNPLTIILGRTEDLQDLAFRGPDIPSNEVLSISEKISETVVRISRIIRGLRFFAREVESDPFERTSIKNIVEDTMELCGERFRAHGVNVRIPEISPMLLIECRPTQIAQVLLNLLSNAFDAIQNTRNPWVELKISETEKNIEFSVTDSGEGIPEKYRARVIQPFFTTKKVGKGTGLGLSISKGIIDSHSGRFWLDTQCPNTRFVFVLPKRQRDIRIG